MARKRQTLPRLVSIPFSVSLLASSPGTGTANIQISQLVAPILRLGVTIDSVNVTFKALDGVSIVYMGTKSGKSLSTGFHEYESTLNFSPNSIVGTDFVVGGSAKCLRV
jgi:hypothetical protein